MSDVTRKILCGEWGFRHLPMEHHFEITKSFGMKVMEFGIGGGQTGRLSEAPTAAEIAEFEALGERYEIATPFNGLASQGIHITF